MKSRGSEAGNSEADKNKDVQQKSKAEQIQEQFISRLSRRT